MKKIGLLGIMMLLGGLLHAQSEDTTTITASTITINHVVMNDSLWSELGNRWKSGNAWELVMCAEGEIITADSKWGPQKYIKIDSLIETKSMAECPKKTLGVFGFLREETLMQNGALIRKVFKKALDAIPSYSFIAIVWGVSLEVKNEKIVEMTNAFWVPRLVVNHKVQ